MLRERNLDVFLRFALRRVKPGYTQDLLDQVVEEILNDISLFIDSRSVSVWARGEVDDAAKREDLFAALDAVQQQMAEIGGYLKATGK